MNSVSDEGVAGTFGFDARLVLPDPHACMRGGPVGSLEDRRTPIPCRPLTSLSTT